MIAQNIGFWIIALVMIVAALRVVTTNNVVHAALWLVVSRTGLVASWCPDPPWHYVACPCQSW